MKKSLILLIGFVCPFVLAVDEGVSFEVDGKPGMAKIVFRNNKPRVKWQPDDRGYTRVLAGENQERFLEKYPRYKPQFEATGITTGRTAGVVLIGIALLAAAIKYREEIKRRAKELWYGKQALGNENVKKQNKTVPTQAR